MKKTIITVSAFAIMALAACSGTNQQGAGTDSPDNANDTTYNTDTVIKTTDTTATGLDNSGSGGTELTDSAAKQ
ncbi:MAG: hypothetical protein EOP54_30390 [Sphingobacteriales bacterium]|nr:MAG: hypothetical protein EOP54_30390 [Sphingobacteriales bacterium]